MPSAAARRLALRFGFDPDRLEGLGAFESEVLAAGGAAGPAILKVIDPAHRTPDEVRAEIDWLLALHEAGIPAARPRRARDGAWLALDGDPPTIAVAYERAPGRHLPPGEWTPELFRAHGALVGRLQAHARGWTPPGPRRRGWREAHALARAPEALPDDADFLEAADAFLGPYLAGFDAVAPRPAGGADAVATILSMRQADLAIFLRLDVPEARWDDGLRAAAVRLRDRTAARHEVVPRDVLRKHFGEG